MDNDSILSEIFDEYEEVFQQFDFDDHNIILVDLLCRKIINTDAELNKTKKELDFARKILENNESKKR